MTSRIKSILRASLALRFAARLRLAPASAFAAGALLLACKGSATRMTPLRFETWPAPCASVTLQLQLRSAAGRFSVRERAGMKSAKKAGASTHPLSCSKMRQGQGTAHASRGSHPFNPPAAARQLRKSALRLRLQALMLRCRAKASCIILPPAREELAAFRRCSASLHAAPLRDPLRSPERAARAAFLRACACS